MTPQQLELIKATVPVLRENGVALTSYFYQRMLNAYPELKNTFNLDHQNNGMQPRALAAAVLAYASNIDNPSVLAQAVERITTKHVSLNIQPDQYAIVGEQLLLSISEVLKVSMQDELIAAWKVAYLQLADLLIAAEQAKYAALNQQQGGWSGWREFNITALDQQAEQYRVVLTATDQNDVVTAQDGALISVRVQVPNQDFKQPQQFKVLQNESNQYHLLLEVPENPSEFCVAQILVQHYQVGDQVEVSAPFTL